jgi:hypothetical protein
MEECAKPEAMPPSCSLKVGDGINEKLTVFKIKFIFEFTINPSNYAVLPLLLFI